MIYSEGIPILLNIFIYAGMNVYAGLRRVCKFMQIGSQEQLAFLKGMSVGMLFPLKSTR